MTFSALLEPLLPVGVEQLARRDPPARADGRPAEPVLVHLQGWPGTGKSFLTRLLIAGVIRWGQACNLIFDMHNDYGWQITTEGGYNVKGLKQLFDSRVTILTLDAESSRRRNAKYDFDAAAERSAAADEVCVYLDRRSPRS